MLGSVADEAAAIRRLERACEGEGVRERRVTRKSYAERATQGAERGMVDEFGEFFVQHPQRAHRRG